MAEAAPLPSAIPVDLRSKTDLLRELRRRIRLTETVKGSGLSTGVAAIDAHLPGGGLLRGALHEIVPQDYRAISAGLGFLIALAIRLLDAGEGAVLWPRLPQDDRDFGALYGLGLRQMGFDPGRLLLARCRSVRDLLWTLEEGARQGGLGAVISARPPKMSLTQSRRLHLAASQSKTPVLLLRRAEDEGPSAAVTRWRIGPMPSARDEHGFLRAFRWQVRLERVRGGLPGRWAVEWNHDTCRFNSSSVLADGEVSQDASADDDSRSAFA